MKRTPRKASPVRDAYLVANPNCEVTAWFHSIVNRSSQDTRLAMLDWVWSLGLSVIPCRPVQVDHLWGGTAGRLDLRSMLIVVHPAWHEWKTAHKTAGMLLFLVIKSRKAPSEVSASEFHQCSGMHLKGWLGLDRTVAACPKWLDEYRLRLISSLA